VDLRRDSAAAEADVADLVSRVSEATASPVPDEEAARWARGHREAAARDAIDAADRLGLAGQAEAAARTALTDARTLADRQARLAAARAELDRLVEAAADHDVLRDRLRDARRAAGVPPLHRVALAANKAHAAALRSAPDRQRAELAGQLERAVAEAARIRALEPQALRLRQVRAETRRLERRREELAAAEQQARHDARQLVARLRTQVAEAEQAYAAARRLTLDLRERAIALREERVNGIAAELAAGLVVGGTCPVCGSCDHPRKAVAAADGADEAAEKTAQRAADDAAATEFLRKDELRDLTAALQAATAQVDTTPPELAAEAAAVAAGLDHLSGEVAELELALADHDDSRLGRCAEQEREARAGLAALDEVDRCAAAVLDAEQAVQDAAAEAGFASGEDALAAALEPAGYDELAARLADYDRAVAAAERALAEPDAEEVTAAAVPDLDALAEAHRIALDGLGRARAREQQATALAQRLDDLVARLEQALARWEPLRADLELVTGLSSFVEGKAADNRLQMRLSAYVLGYRLAQVVAAANARLAGMSDQRYSLEHTPERGAGETRGGLSLLIRDDWSGETRDPATLSGGETFVVSLALALGLADVVTQEAGGADLDTLFVDEGFGSLDADTLDDVMDTLDSLRDGGRVVGVVSHVAEMRDRIPTQLQVTKSRAGSTLAFSR